MKNRYIEALIEKSKRYAKKAKNDSRWNHKLGLKIYHVYDDEREYTWWDDVAFMHGSHQVVVWLVHPRLEYSDKNSDIAYNSFKNERKDEDDIFANSVPVYKYLGKNKKRKKIVAWESKFEDNDRTFFDKWKEEEERLKREGDYVQTCSMTVKQYGYCRGVSLVAPFEVKKPEDFVPVRDFVVACFNDPSLFQKTFGDYTYSREDWVRENS